MKLYIGNTRLSKPFLMNHPDNNDLPALKLNPTETAKVTRCRESRSTDNGRHQTRSAKGKAQGAKSPGRRTQRLACHPRMLLSGIQDVKRAFHKDQTTTN